MNRTGKGICHIISCFLIAKTICRSVFNLDHCKFFNSFIIAEMIK